MDEARSWQVIHDFTEMRQDVNKLTVRMQREAHQSKLRMASWQRHKHTYHCYDDEQAEIQEKENDLVYDLRKEEREQLPRVMVEPCVDQ